jgi:hypothetical protein
MRNVLRAESRVGTDGENYYLTDFSHRFIWWQCKDDVTKLADQVQHIQIRRIERDVFEAEELARRCLRLLSGGDNTGGGGDDDGSGGGSGSDSGGGGGGGGVRRRRGGGGGGGGGGKRSRSVSVSLPPPVARARSVGGAEQRESNVKVRGDTTDGTPAATGRRERGSRFEVVRPDRDAEGRIVVDVGGPVDVDRRRDRDRDRPAPVYVERERERSRYGDRDRDRDRDRYR